MAELDVRWLGRVDYEWAWAEQRRMHAAVVDGQRPDTVLLLEHDPVFTAGKRTTQRERPDDGTPVVDVDRGGRITWHGPGQLTGYPIVTLPDPMDVVGHVRRLEEALIRVCAGYGLAAVRVPGRSGVWLPASAGGGGGAGGSTADRPERKVAAIGIRVARGVSMHGFGLNCDPDLGWFDRIVPCGISDAAVTSLSAELGRRVGVPDVLEPVERELRAVLDPVPSR